MSGEKRARSLEINSHTPILPPPQPPGLEGFGHAIAGSPINREHAEDASGGWALGYRGWHELTIQRCQDGRWRPATGPGLGRERVLAASVPLFAASSSPRAEY
jgi:hypothetical protein